MNYNIFIIGGLLVIIVIIVIVSQYYRKVVNPKLSKDNLIHQFGGDPSKTKNEVNLKCDSGKINVIDAWYEVYDPYYQLMGNGDSNNNFAVGDDGDDLTNKSYGLYGTDTKGDVVGAIDDDGDCGNDKCSKKLASKAWGIGTNKKILDGNGNMIYSKLCKYTTVEGYDNASDGGSGKCYIQNVLPIMSKLANGKTSAQITLDNFASPCSGNFSGDDNCSLEQHQSNSKCNSNNLANSSSKSYYDSSIKFFPIGSPTLNLTDDKTSTINAQQGYYIHGTYTCELD